jgi:quercetin dioxygenase-like cupin family protein
MRQVPAFPEGGMLGDKTIVMNAGDTITIAPGVFHNASCISEEEADMIVVYSEGVRGFELEQQ